MATNYSVVEYIADGITEQFAVNFPSGYIKQADVFVSVDGVDTVFTWLSEGLLALSPAPVAGAYIRVYRSTEIITPVNNYQDGSVIIEKNLDDSFAQTLFVTQEVYDRLENDALLIDTVDGNYDATNRLIKNIASPINDADAATKGWVNISYNSGVDAGLAQIAAEAARDIAIAKADIATAQAVIATDQATISTNQATISTNQATISTNQAGLASTYANTAESAVANLPVGVTVGTILNLVTTPTTSDSVFVKDYHGDTEGGGGVFVWDETAVKDTHNGGTIIDPDVAYPTSWSDQVQLQAWFDGSSNVTTGCWVRKYDGAVNVRWFGAIGDAGTTDNYLAYNAVKSLNTEVDIPDSQNNYFLSNIVDGVLSAFSPGPTTLWKNFTSNGKLKWFTGFFSDGEFGSNIWRFRDRLFVGDAADYSGNRLGVNGYGTSWVTAKVGSYLAKNATMAVAANELDEINGARYGLVSFSKSMGVGAIALNDGAGTTARGLYSEVVHNPTTGGASTSIEAQCGNFTGILPVANAYSMSGSQVNGVQIASEAGTGYTVGDADTPITPATQPSGAAIDITGGSTVSPEHSWVTGMVFRDGALNRDDVTSNAIAISLSRKHELIWGVGISAPRVSYIRSEVSSINTSSGVILQDRGVKFEGYGDKHIFEVYDAVAASGVAANYLRVTNSLANSPVTLEALGTDVDIDVRLKTKGNGVPRFGNVASVSTETITGYITIKDSAGVLRKLAVLS